MQLSFTEENYLKAIYMLQEKSTAKINTNSISSVLETRPASVTDMLRKLAIKKLLNYEKYQGVSLTPAGKRAAIAVIRKHRLWEHFLVTKLGFAWDEVHEIAEQLEHIQSEQLVKKLYQFLGRPKWDPHGDPIPDEHGNFYTQNSTPLSTVEKNSRVVISGVMDHATGFLQYLDKNHLSLGTVVSVKNITDYDHSMQIVIDGSKNIKHISSDVARNILVTTYK